MTKSSIDYISGQSQLDIREIIQITAKTTEDIYSVDEKGSHIIQVTTWKSQTFYFHLKSFNTIYKIICSQGRTWKKTTTPQNKKKTKWSNKKFKELFTIWGKKLDYAKITRKLNIN